MTSLRMVFQKIVCCFVILALLLAPSAPAAAFTVGEEKELGEKLLSLVRREFKLLDDPDVTQYINDLGREILTMAGPQFFDYHFFVINNREFNAFAAPSGLIFFHSGLIEITDTEGELVSVMAHEIGHAASRHYADRLSKSKKVSAGTTALALAGLAMGAGPLGQALMTGSLAAGTTMQLQFSRQDEEEADRLAFTWMLADHRDPSEMLGMLQKMRKITRYRQGKIPPYLLTHPEPENRYSYIEDRILQEPLPKAFKPADDFAFQRIKYRLLTLTKEPQDLLPLLQNKAQTTDTKNVEGAMVHYGLFQVYLANREYDKAQAELAVVMQRFPDRPMLLADLGVLYLESGQQAKALDTLSLAVKREPNNAYALFHQAVALQQGGKAAKALSIFEQLLTTQPDYSRLHYRIGQIKTAQGDKPAGHYHLGVFHWYEGDVKTARFHLKEAMRDQPEDSAVKRQAKELLDTIERLEKMS
ncbi:MAG TPA: M48 family metalloprotease [Desulfurivibrionaceae bacterium]|nr:M48 family metalloprotease [Desulfurivibrionaceae bacterium]